MAKLNLTPLVIKAQTGDSDALNDLMGKCYETLFYYAYNTVKNEDLAGDITQESCIEIIKTLGNLRNPAAFITWAGRIVAHQCTHYYRQTKDEVYLEENEDGETILDQLTDENRDNLPEQVQEDKEFKRILWEMLDSLPVEQRQALLLYYMETMSVGEIAEIQGKTVGTVKSRLNYGRKAVIAKVNDYEKKTGVRLHSIAPLPLLLYFLFQENMANVLADSSATLQQIRTGISSAATAAAGTSAGAAVAGAPAAVAGTAVGGTAAGTAVGGTAAGTVGIAGTGIVAKIIAGIVAAAAVVGVAVGGLVKNVGPRQETPMAAYAGHWTCIPVDGSEDGLVDVTEPMNIHENGTMEYLGQTYNLRMVNIDGLTGCEEVLAATPCDIIISDPEEVTAADSFCIEFQSSNDINTAYLFKSTSYQENTDIELIGIFYRESDYENYTAVTLTEDNILEYIQLSHVSWGARHLKDEYAVEIYSVFHLGFRQGVGAASYCSLNPTIEYDRIFVTLCSSVESADVYDFIIGPKIKTDRISYSETPYSFGPTLYLANDQIRSDNYLTHLENGQTPEGLLAVAANEGYLIGADNVFGVVFVPSDWKNSHTHDFTAQYIIEGNFHRGKCICRKTTEAEAHSYEERICTVCGSRQYSEGLEFSVLSDRCTLNGIGTCTDTDIVIPAYYDGLPVTSIDENAFRDCEQITSVFIPETVVFIDQWAFMSCSNLKQIHFSEGLVRTEDLVFIWCTSLEYIEFPSSLVKTGHSLFNECSSLKHVVFSEGMTEIQYGMLTNCDSLTSVTIPASVTKIGDCVFGNCTKLTDIYYGGTMQQWEEIIKMHEETWGMPETNWAYNSGDFTVHCTDGDLTKTEALKGTRNY